MHFYNICVVMPFISAFDLSVMFVISQRYWMKFIQASNTFALGLRQLWTVKGRVENLKYRFTPDSSENIHLRSMHI